MSLLPTWPIAAGALVIGIVAGAGTTALVKNAKIDRIELAWAKEKRNIAAQRETEQVFARAAEQTGSIAVTRALQEKEDEKAAIAAQRDAAVASLRNRPERRIVVAGPAAAPPANCQGSTGAELSRPDAEFLVGEATRADNLRAALVACYSQYDGAKAALDQYANDVSTRDTTARPTNATNR
jgi:hypothetical protein